MSKTGYPEASKECTAAVLQVVCDTQNFRVAILPPQIARKLARSSLKESEDPLGTLENAVLVELPLKNLLYESWEVQRLYYQLDNQRDSKPPIHSAKSTLNSLLLLDPIRLSTHIKKRLNSMKRQLLMRCFSPKIWLIFFKLVSLGVGSKLREQCSQKNNPIADDSFLEDLETLQMRLLELTISMTSGDPKGYTIEDIEYILLQGCREILLEAQKIKEMWKRVVKETPLLSELIPYLSKCVYHIRYLIAPQTVDGSQDFADEKIARKPEKDDDDDDGQLKKINARLLRDSCRAILTVVSKSAKLLSLIKFELLNSRQLRLQVPGALCGAKNGFVNQSALCAPLSELEIVQLVILSHCLGAYGIREWGLRLMTLRLHNELSEFASKQKSQIDSFITDSAFFRTAGTTNPRVQDYMTLLPYGLLEYALSL